MSFDLTPVGDPWLRGVPYLFVSYSHKDQARMDQIKIILEENRIRYWYDDGLHSGDDWNMVIARHLEKATLCLLLLSPDSAASEYVKNELNFAQNHRIPIQVLLLQKFPIPVDIEMMTGRFHRIEMIGDYHKELIKSLPGEIFYKEELDNPGTQQGRVKDHPLFSTGELQSDRQGTRRYCGAHKYLFYPCTVLEDLLQKDQIEEAWILSRTVCMLRHPVFPILYDISFDGQKMMTFQEYYEGQFLDDYLKDHQPDQDTIIRWTDNIVQGIAYLYERHFSFRDFARGSMIVDRNNYLRFFRLHHPYYGLISTNEENRQYFFEQSLQEIAILLAQLCLKTDPKLPIRIIESDSFEKNFLDKVNVIIQKCAREKGRSRYSSFEELLQDIRESRIRLKDMVFLRKRKKKLLAYDRERANREELFVSTDTAYDMLAYRPSESIEERYGFEGTAVLSNYSPDQTVNGPCKISVQMCSTGIPYHFDKDTIIVGKGHDCDLTWTQPSISRRHVQISYYDETSYLVKDLYSSNGTYTLDEGPSKQFTRLSSGENHVIKKDSILRLAEDSDLKLL